MSAASPDAVATGAGAAADLSRLLAPRSVAVVGATERPAAYGSEALLNLQRWGFPGRVYAVNPGRASAHGVPCAGSLGDLPEAPDAVVVAVPAAAAAAVVQEAAALGCGAAVVFAAGFAEARAGGADQLALDAGLPVCGPNGNGLVALHARAPLWGDMVAPRPAGAVALVSQSGNVAVNALGARRGLRLHTAISCGNQAVLSAEDYVRALAGTPGVRSIALYLEADGDGERWCEALEACARAGVGVAVLKAGASAAGAAAARTHTAALAGDQRAFRALALECGAAWASDPDGLLELAKALAVVGGRRAARPGVAVMTCSGGDAAIAADLAAKEGVALPPLAPPTVAALEAVLPGAAAAANPLDFTSLLWDNHAALRAIVRALAGDPAVGQVLVLHDTPPDLDGAARESWDGVLGAVRDGARDAAGAGSDRALVAVASTLPELAGDETAAAVQADGLAMTAGLRPALRVAAALAAPAPDAARIAQLRAAAARARRDGDGWIGEAPAKSLLREAGLPVPPGRLARDPGDAVAAWRELAAPVAVKGAQPGLLHKSDAGAVALGLDDEAAVRAAAERLGTVLVEAMAPPGAELLVAARADAVVPVLVVGVGGIWAEIADDVAVVPLPASQERVERALRSLRAAPLLTGGRGRPPLDLAAAARIAAAAGELLLDGGLALLELNPVIVHERSATVVDAVARGGTS